MRSSAWRRSAPAPEPRTRLNQEKANAIVVLGCRLFAGGRPSERLRRRMMLAVGLYREGAAQLLVMSGGGTGPVAEALVMRDLAQEAGVPETALLLEAESRNTFENAANTARLLQAVGKSRIVLVSDRAHLPRAARLFRRAGLDVVGVAGVPASSTRRAIEGALYEAASLARGLFRRRTR
jgi:uncharacterized SAM-binding protein YcdF (DUF218 family)